MNKNGFKQIAIRSFLQSVNFPYRKSRRHQVVAFTTFKIVNFRFCSGLAASRLPDPFESDFIVINHDGQVSDHGIRLFDDFYDFTTYESPGEISRPWLQIDMLESRFLNGFTFAHHEDDSVNVQHTFTDIVVYVSDKPIITTSTCMYH